MTKPLSEQVAELERQITEVWDIAEAWKLNSERHWNRVEELEAECDDLQRQVQEARFERDEAQAEVERLTESRDDWRRFGREHVARANRFHAENANLRAKAEALKEHPVPTSYADDDHQDAEVTQWWDPEHLTTDTSSKIVSHDIASTLTVKGHTEDGQSIHIEVGL